MNKLRAYIKETKEMKDVDRIDFLNNTVSFINKETEIYYTSYNIDDVDIMECTGKVDSNNNPIYEGDIVIGEINNNRVFGQVKIVDTNVGTSNIVIISETEQINLSEILNNCNIIGTKYFEIQ